eukprot:gene11345-11494_t
MAATLFRTRVFGGSPDAFHVACEYSCTSLDSRAGCASPSSSNWSPLARLELDWTSAEAETQVVERFVQRQSQLLLSHSEERLLLQLEVEPIATAADFPHQHVSVHISTAAQPPVLCSLQFTRTSGTGNAGEALVAALLKHMDLAGVRRVQSCEGLGSFYVTCAEPRQWCGLTSLNLSSCGLAAVPSAVGLLSTIKVLRLNHNRLTSLPPDIGQLHDLEVLSANHNQLATLPGELRRCGRLRELHLEHNRLASPLLDLTHATDLVSLQLYGNPLEYLPELTPAVGLRSFSLANVRIMADQAFSRWEVEVTAPSSSYLTSSLSVMGPRSHKLQPLFNLLFRRSSMQHPLLTGALSRLVEDPANLELLVREDVALQQLVLSSMGSNSLVVEQAVNVMAAAGSYAGAARRLVRHNVVDAVKLLLDSDNTSKATAEQVRCAALHALGNSAFDPTNRRRYLQSPGLMQLLAELAASPDIVSSGGLKDDGNSSGGSGNDIHSGRNEQVRIALSLPAIRGRGLRVLAMDGGGMKGMAMVELLRQLERRAGVPIWTLFDVICGTSTGGLLAVGLGILRLSLDECQDIYTKLGNKVFNQSHSAAEGDELGWRDSLYRMYATSSANMRVAVYGAKHEAAPYEELLRQFCAVKELGCPSDRLIDTAIMGGPKVFVVATLASARPAAPFAFRNYELPDEAAPAAAALAACAGSCKHHVWEAVRASSAAPYYLDDFLTSDGKRFQDGATTANNPAVIALQQARLLHPQLPIDCLVSLGCGAEPPQERSKGLSAVIDTGAVLLESACSVDRVHEALVTTMTLIPGAAYYRFNPVDQRCAMELDDIKPESWRKLIAATMHRGKVGFGGIPSVHSAPDLNAKGGPAALLTPEAAAGSGYQQQLAGRWLGPQKPQPIRVSGMLQRQLSLASATAGASGLGVLHLALHSGTAGLVCGWQQQVTAVVEPGAAAQELLLLLNADPSSTTISQLVAAAGPLTMADQQMMLKLQDWYPLLSHLQQLVVVCSSWLPPDVIAVLLRGGVAAVVTATQSTAPAVESMAGDSLAEFFGAFYEGVLHHRLDIHDALCHAAEAMPAAAGLFHCYQLD